MLRASERSPQELGMNDAIIPEGQLNGRRWFCAMSLGSSAARWALSLEKSYRGSSWPSRGAFIAVSCSGGAHDGRNNKPDAARQSFGGL
jgi:hypothetical protein